VTDDDLQRWGASRQMPAPSPAEARRLVARASSRSWWWLGWLVLPVVPGGLVLAASAAALALALSWSTSTPEVSVPEVAPAVIAEDPGPPRLGPGTHVLGTDEVAVDGEVVVAERGDATVLDLARGTVTVHAARRAPGASLRVVSEDWTVVVVGTRFTVVRAPFSVEVTEGVVEVQRGADRWTLRAGDHFEDGHLRAKPVAPLPALPDLRTQLLRGDAVGARTGLGQRLAADPDDTGAWTLLAQLEARAGQREPAVAAWREVIGRGTLAEAQRGRFEASVLLEDRPADAIPLLVTFLATPDPLRAEALLRLGRAQVAVGDRDAARATLSDLVAAHPGTGPAELGRQLLLTF
jgi:hypothetical protein